MKEGAQPVEHSEVGHTTALIVFQVGWEDHHLANFRTTRDAHNPGDFVTVDGLLNPFPIDRAVELP